MYNTYHILTVFNKRTTCAIMPVHNALRCGGWWVTIICCYRLLYIFIYSLWLLCLDLLLDVDWMKNRIRQARAANVPSGREGNIGTLGPATLQAALEHYVRPLNKTAQVILYFTWITLSV